LVVDEGALIQQPDVDEPTYISMISETLNVESAEIEVSAYDHTVRKLYEQL